MNEQDPALIDLAVMASPPAALHSNAVQVGEVVHLSGHIGWKDGGPTDRGTLGATLDLAAGRAAARRAALSALHSLEQQIGDLRRVTSVSRLFGMVRATPDFEAHPGVIDGASEVLLEVFGTETGAHARSAVGVSSLPLGAAVEVELTVTVAPSVPSSSA